LALVNAYLHEKGSNGNLHQAGRYAVRNFPAIPPLDTVRDSQNDGEHLNLELPS
jgi:hypothetical protein